MSMVKIWATRKGEGQGKQDKEEGEVEGEKEGEIKDEERCFDDQSGTWRCVSVRATNAQHV